MNLDMGRHLNVFGDEIRCCYCWQWWCGDDDTMVVVFFFLLSCGVMVLDFFFVGYGGGVGFLMGCDGCGCSDGGVESIGYDFRLWLLRVERW